MVVGMNILSCRSLTFHVIHTPDAASIGKTAGPYTVLTYAVAVSIVWCVEISDAYNRVDMKTNAVSNASV
jgi:hypothetical protein